MGAASSCRVYSGLSSMDLKPEQQSGNRERIGDATETHLSIRRYLDSVYVCVFVTGFLDSEQCTTAD